MSIPETVQKAALLDGLELEASRRGTRCLWWEQEGASKPSVVGRESPPASRWVLPETDSSTKPGFDFCS